MSAKITKTAALMTGKEAEDARNKRISLFIATPEGSTDLCELNPDGTGKIRNLHLGAWELPVEGVNDIYWNQSIQCGCFEVDLPYALQQNLAKIVGRCVKQLRKCANIKITEQYLENAKVRKIVLPRTGQVVKTFGELLEWFSIPRTAKDTQAIEAMHFIQYEGFNASGCYVKMLDEKFFILCIRLNCTALPLSLR